MGINEVKPIISTMVALNSRHLLAFIGASAQGFNAGLCQPGRPTRPRGTRMCPLFFADIEPEIRSNTMPSDITFMHCTSVAVESSNSGDYSSRDKSNKIAVTRMKSTDNFISPAISSSYRPKTGRGTPDTLKSYKSHKAIWQTRYNELKVYQAQNGHCMLPQSYGPNPKLGWWVMQQRRQYTLKQRGKKSSFDGPDGKKRIELLDAIGFVWRIARRGSHGSIIGNRHRMVQCKNAEESTIMTNGVVIDEVFDVNDFEKYMIENSEKFSDEDIRAAWSQRFEYFRSPERM